MPSTQIRDVRSLLACYFIMGSNQAGSRDPLYILEEALKGGITLFQFREKGKDALTGTDKKLFAQECQTLCRQYSIPFVVNDDPELAMELDADGIHVGQEDSPDIWVPRFIDKGKLAGLSVHNLTQADHAISWRASYVGVGPIYETPSKEDAKKPAGTTVLGQIHKRYPDLPITAIGGLTAANTPPVIRAGASGVSVISAIAAAPDVREAAKKIRETVEVHLQDD